MVGAVHHPMILYEQRPPRWVHAIFLLPALGLSVLFIDLVFLPDRDLLPLTVEEKFSTLEQVLFGAFTLIAVFMSGVLLYRLIRNPWTFRLTDEGFIYNPAGVSTGLIRWTDIVEIRDVPVTTQNSVVGGQAPLMTTGIILKDPHSYIARYPAALGVLFEFRKYDSGTPLVFQFKEFGRDHDKVIALMKEQVRRANARK